MRTPRIVKPPTNPLLRVGVDIDNTLIRNDTVWRQFLQMRQPLCGHRIVRDDEVQRYWDYWEIEVCKDCFYTATINQAVLRAHRLRPGATDILTRLAEAGIEFSLVTGRPLGAKNATMMWLRDKNICPPRLFQRIIFDSLKIGAVMDNHIDVMIDDSTAVLKRLQTSARKVSTVLMAGTHNTDYASVLTPDVVAHSWRDVENYLVGRLAVEAAIPHYDALDKVILKEQGVVF